jgi:hypothetical protein
MIDNKFRKPRIWSNEELQEFSHDLKGKIVNVSGWKDIDKQGKRYKEYFSQAQEYWITNYISEARGFQGNLENEIFLDLSKPLAKELHGQFDVVLNHTVLEHIFEVNMAFENICLLSNDLVTIVVPFLQEQHTKYGDYWRFSPQAIDKLFLKNKLKTIYLNYNDNRKTSIYVFAIGSKNPDRWSSIINHPNNKIQNIYTSCIGTKVISNGFFSKFLSDFLFCAG